MCVCLFFIYIYFIYLLVGSLVVIVIMVYIASRYIQDMLIVLCGCDDDSYVLFHSAHGSDVRCGRSMILYMYTIATLT